MIIDMPTLPKPLFIERSRNTPEVVFQPEMRLFEITGVSFPENSKEFFEPLLTYLHECESVIESGTTFSFKLDYFNTSSARCILDVFNAIDRLNHSGKEVVINWYYSAGDEELREVGEEFGMLVNCPINLKMAM